MWVPSVEWVMITSSCPLVILSAVVLEPRATWTKLSINHHMAIPGQEEAPCLDGTYFVSSLDAPCSSSSKVKSVWAPALLFSPSAPEEVLCPPTYVPTPAITAPAQPTQAEGEAAPVHFAQGSASSSQVLCLPCFLWDGLLSTRETLPHSWARWASSAASMLPCPHLTSLGQAKLPQAVSQSGLGLGRHQWVSLWGCPPPPPKSRNVLVHDL